MLTEEMMVSLAVKLSQAMDALRRQGDQLEGMAGTSARLSYIEKQRQHAQDAVEKAIAILTDALPGLCPWGM